MWAKRWAVVGWIAFGISLALAYYLYRARVMHPHFFPMCSLFLVQIIAMLAAITYGTWQIYIGHERLRSLGWLLLSIFPVSFWGWLILTGLAASQSRVLKLDFKLKACAGVGASILDGVCRIQFRHRLEGDKCVMIYNDPPETAAPFDPKADVAAMDRHIERLEELIGRKCKAKVHWIRGSPMGIYGRYFQGLALGSDPSKFETNGYEPDDSGLVSLDRHEVAHFVLHHHCGPDADVPSLLIEGWAETQSDYGNEFYLSSRLSDLDLQQQLCSLEQLTSEYWYNRMLSPVYNQGGALADYLIAKEGIEKFVDLYLTVRRDTIAEDFERVYGVDLQQLDEDYRLYCNFRADLDLTERLQDLPLGEQVNNELWDRFVTEYPAALRKLKDRYPTHPIVYDVEQVFKGIATIEDGKPEPTEPQYETRTIRSKIYHANDQHAEFCAGERYDWENKAVIGNPDFSFAITESGEDIIEYPGSDGYISACREIRSDVSAIVEPRYAAGRGSLIDSLSSARISSVSSSIVDGEEQVTLKWRFEGESEGQPFARDAMVVLLPNRHWAVHKHETQFFIDGNPTTLIEGQVDYHSGETHKLIPSSVVWTCTSDDKLVEENRGTTKINNEPIDPAVFTSEHYGFVRALPAKEGQPWFVTLVGSIALVTLVGATISLLKGKVLEAVP